MYIFVETINGEINSDFLLFYNLSDIEDYINHYKCTEFIILNLDEYLHQIHLFTGYVLKEYHDISDGVLK